MILKELNQENTMNVFLSSLTIPMAAAALTTSAVTEPTAQASEHSGCSSALVSAAEGGCTGAKTTEVINASNNLEGCPATAQCSGMSKQIVDSTTTGSGNTELQIINVDTKAQGDNQTVPVVVEKSGAYGLGDVVSPFSALHAQSGAEKSLKDLAGSKATVVIFWNQNCPYVEGANGAATSVEEFYNAYKDKGVSVIAIDAGASNSTESITEYAKAKPFPVLINSDSTLAAKFNASYTPNTFILDQDMKLVYSGAFYTGTGETRVLHTENAIKEILAGNSPTVTSTKGVGCSIKWAGGKKPTV